MKRSILLTGLLVSCTLSFAGDPDAGREKAKACIGCHGKDGISVAPTFPNLAGQKAAYIEASLKAFRAKERTGNQAKTMYPMAANLSDTDIADLAAWFSSLPVKP